MCKQPLLQGALLQQVDAMLGVSRQQQLEEEEAPADEAFQWAGPSGSQMERLRSQAAIDVAAHAAAEVAELSELSVARRSEGSDESMRSSWTEPLTPSPADGFAAERPNRSSRI